MGGWAIALHGGAGMICKEKMSVDEMQRTEAALYQILDIGVTALETNNNNNKNKMMMTAVDVVELVVSNWLQVPSDSTSSFYFGPCLYSQPCWNLVNE